MFINVNDIFNHPYNVDVVFNSGLFDGVETDDFQSCDMIALIHRGREIIRALPAYYTNDTKQQIVVEDPKRNLRDNMLNTIQLVRKPGTVEPWHVHIINGMKFTCVTLNTRDDRAMLGTKYYHRDNWL